MALIVGHDGSASCTTIAARTGQSGGSVGGVKKAGTWGGNFYMSVPNIGQNYTYRVPQGNKNLFFNLTNTTRHPVQYRRGSYAVTHSGMLG